MAQKKNKRLALEGGFRTEAERNVPARIKEVWDRCPDPWSKKLESLSKYIRRQNLTRILVQYEIFKRILPVMGSIIECGVFRGAGLMTWAKLSAILEPVNLTRRIYGFDTFEGFPKPSEEDLCEANPTVRKGQLFSNSQNEIEELVHIFDADRFLGHIPKVKLIKGVAEDTIPKFVKENQHIVVALLYLDFDLYEATATALKHLVPRMPRGAIIAFDELDNPLWPGETRALFESGLLSRLRIQRLEFDPYVGFAVID